MTQMGNRQHTHTHKANADQIFIDTVFSNTGFLNALNDDQAKEQRRRQVTGLIALQKAVGDGDSA